MQTHYRLHLLKLTLKNKLAKTQSEGRNVRDNVAKILATMSYSSIDKNTIIFNNNHNTLLIIELLPSNAIRFRNLVM